ncbi:MAG: hypothetical protein ACI4QG_04875 [Candidatus Cryptobacteroides sp.]
MYSAIKYILLIIMALMSVYSAAEWQWRSTAIKEWWNRKPWGKVGFWLVVLVVVLTILTEIGENQDARKDRASMEAQIRRLEEISESARTEVQTAGRELASTRTELHNANNQILEQSRQVGSLVYNIRTSFEGKMRFAKCLEDLSDLTPDSFYEPLLCEDGVAVFRFAREDESLNGFYFFANSEVNEVLSGVPMSGGGECPGKVAFSRESEVSKTMTRFMNRRTPEWENDGMGSDRALREIAGLVKTFCRYVLRSKRTQVLMTKPPAWYVTISYDVDPFATEPCERFISSLWHMSFVQSLHGVRMEEFSRMLLDRFASEGVYPKIRVKDVRGLNKRIVEDELWRVFPYALKEVGR